MKLTDIAPLKIWLALEQKINERSSLNTSVFNVDGVRITDFKNGPINSARSSRPMKKGRIISVRSRIKILRPKRNERANRSSPNVMPG
jgi:hypothetical protein